jgi:hypothetical protein
MEMVSGQAMVLSLMACALLSSGVARLISPPLYGELAALLMPVPDPPDAQPSEPTPASDRGTPLPSSGPGPG